MVLGPIAAAVLPPLLASLFGAFENFRWVDKPVTPLEAFGILGAMCFPVAAYFYARMRWEIAMSELSRSWQTVTGTLLRRDVKKRYVYRAGTRYLFTVDYTYAVGGQTYRDSQFAYGPHLMLGGPLLDRLTDDYQPQKPVTVHYDPDDPTEAVLYTGDEMARQRMWGVWFLIATPLLIIFVVAIFNGD